MKLQEIINIESINENIILATIVSTKGSVPRNENVSMVISKTNEFGTIGGGELEFQTTKQAKNLLKNNKINEKIIELPLGPSLGQCCGGYVKIKLIKYKNGNDLLILNDFKNKIINNNQNLYIFGAGHVSKAILNKLEGVGFNIFVLDSRQNFISKINHNYVTPILAKNEQIIINNAPPKSYYLIMTHSHKIDLDICSAIINKNDFTFIGLIGSKTKKNSFTKKLLDLGYSRSLIDKIECPIGIKSIIGKEPDIIAISIIGRLLEFKTQISKIEKNNFKLLSIA